ncbi:MAG: flagellar motor switch protein FliN [Acidobacteriota bacterium]|jgi:flagellar motor switch protein FliN/FliY
MASPDQLLVEEFSKQLRLTLEGMLGQTWTIEVAGQVKPEVVAGEQDLHIWAQRLTIHADPLLRVIIGPSGWRAIGGSALQAAGIDDASESDILSTYVEILNQALSGVARVVGSQIGKEVGLAKGEEETSIPSRGRIADLRAQDPDGNEFVIYFGFTDQLIRLLAEGDEESSGNRSGADLDAVADVQRVAVGGERSKMDLLMDVEMPVSVSFGRAQLPLKDVIKLTTGSIVELNRNVRDPVEVIINNCVIARGEVVVVEGNYGIRIHQIVSRAERIRSLN